MAHRNRSGRWFEQFEVGQVVEHAVTRTVTETDNVLFTCLTMNPQPLHLDADFAAREEFGKPLVNSIFTLGLVVGIAVPELTLGTTIANLGFEQVEFPHPVFAGDTVWVETEVIATRASRSRQEAGIVTFEHRGYTTAGPLICRCRRAAFMRRQPAERDS
ncbi:MAG: MaoC family dehydratase [Thermocrispum sp.]